MHRSSGVSRHSHWASKLFSAIKIGTKSLSAGKKFIFLLVCWKECGFAHWFCAGDNFCVTVEFIPNLSLHLSVKPGIIDRRGQKLLDTWKIISCGSQVGRTVRWDKSWQAKLQIRKYLLSFEQYWLEPLKVSSDKKKDPYIFLLHKLY